MPYTCVRCGAASEQCILTVGNTGPICRGCFKLYSEDNETWKKFPNIEFREKYGFINFTGETRIGSFWTQILAELKTQTIREPRADGRPHVIVGAETPLYWKVRSDKPKPIHKIARVKITGYECISLLDVWFDEENAAKDGFVDLGEFRLWFGPDWFDLPLEYQNAIKTFSEMKNAIGSFEIITNLPRKYGKSILMELVEELMKPKYRISWEMVEKAKAVCPNCDYPQGETDLPDIDIFKCTHCGSRFYENEAKNYILVSELKDG